MARRLVRAGAGGLLLWLTGMVVGSVVFAVPTLQATPEVPYLTANPFITIPTLLLWTLLATVLALRPVTRARFPASEGIRIGLVFMLANVLMDLVVVVGAMGVGPRYYGYLGLWLGYASLVVAPWLTGLVVSMASTTDVARA